MKNISGFFGDKSYELMSGIHLAIINMQTTYFGNETITNLGPRIWDLQPEKTQRAPLMRILKNKIKHVKFQLKIRIF